ncbi:arsenite efflux transporter metallochaperone ArsD [Bacillus lacus]|uniref:Arsenite efflux transporter metallochaperone ArsD n=1 Tax=Metabacillus lacus TaxID=1983721 RepID=A0A7X2LYU9_9BACI|nr:arsenite efflux transporter metallochaperone ArsD [Metabacillus lacus]MRX72741.1 arsenite efflux transporter metallochaperone ArsD [Metabacillus lacus]
MSRVEIFDPAMCCSTGVCGPSTDPELTRFASAVFSLEKKGLDIKRYQLTIEPDKFAENSHVSKVLHEKGPDSLPIILVNDQIAKIGEYPSNKELASWFDVKAEELNEKPRVRLSLNIKKQ